MYLPTSQSFKSRKNSFGLQIINQLKECVRNSQIGKSATFLEGSQNSKTISARKIYGFA
jgi:hypothetical protein